MGWTNDALNRLYVYNATTGILELAVDEDGFYFDGGGNQATIDQYGIVLEKDPFDGSYVQIASFSDGTVLYLQPQYSSIPGATYTVPASLLADENVLTAGVQAQGYVVLRSPSINGGARGELVITGDSNTGGFKSEMQFNTQSLYGLYKNMIGAGTVDTYPGLFTVTYTATEKIVDYCRPNAVGVMSTTRAYEVEFNYSFLSTVTSDTIGLRIYAATSATSLTGATLLYDAGTFGSTFTQQSLKWTFDGQPGKYIVIAARRASGSGNGSFFGNYRKLSDVCNAF